MRGPWEKMFSEESDMDTAGTVIWTMTVFGGGTALVLLYFLDTRTEWPPVLRALSCLAGAVLVGGLAASFRWVRWLSSIAACVIFVLWSLRRLAYI